METMMSAMLTALAALAVVSTMLALSACMLASRCSRALGE